MICMCGVGDGKEKALDGGAKKIRDHVCCRCCQEEESMGKSLYAYTRGGLFLFLLSWGYCVRRVV